MSARIFTPVALEAGPLDARIVDQAAEWLIRLQHDDSPAARQECAAWRAADPSHELAWQRLSAFGCELRASAPPRAAATLDQARTGIHRQRRAGLKWLCGLGLTVGVAWHWRASLGDALPMQAFADISTGTGEGRTLTLADGTQLILNSNSAVDISIDAQYRHLILRRGEIMITTAPDIAGRPFLVGTGHGAIAPVGTRFSVRRLEQDGNPIRVAVFEGAVDIRPQGSGSAQRLHAGKQADFTYAGIQPEIDLRAADAAWTQGMLVASRMPLGQFITELARHRSGLLRCDSDAADLLVTGAFPLDDSDRILAMLEQILPVRTEYRTRYWVTLKRR